MESASKMPSSESEIISLLQERICPVELPVELRMAYANRRFQDHSEVEIVNILGTYMGYKQVHDDWQDSAMSLFSEQQTRKLEQIVRYMPSRTFRVLPLYIKNNKGALEPNLVIHTYHPSYYVDFDKRTYRTFDEFRCENRLASGTLYFPAGGEIQYDPETGELLVEKCVIKCRDGISIPAAITMMGLTCVPVVGMPALIASSAYALTSSGLRLYGAYKHKQASKALEWIDVTTNAVVAASSTVTAVTAFSKATVLEKPFCRIPIPNRILTVALVGADIIADIKNVNWSELSHKERVIIACRFCISYVVAIDLNEGHRLFNLNSNGLLQHVVPVSVNLLSNLPMKQIGRSSYAVYQGDEYVFGMLKIKPRTVNEKDVIQLWLQLKSIWNSKGNLNSSLFIDFMSSIYGLCTKLKDVEVTLYGQHFILPKLCQLVLFEVSPAVVLGLLQAFAILYEENGIVTNVRRWVNDDPALFRCITAEKGGADIYCKRFRKLHSLQQLCSGNDLRVTSVYTSHGQPTLILNESILIDATMTNSTIKKLLQNRIPFANEITNDAEERWRSTSMSDILKR